MEQRAVELPNCEETHVRVEEDDSVQAQNRIEVAAGISPFGVPQAICLTIGAKEYCYLWNQIKEKLTDAKSKKEKFFYGYLERFISNQSVQNKGQVLISDVEKVKDLLGEFELTMKEMDNKENDFYDLRLYGGWIEGIIQEAKETLNLSE
jgi:hypothetical protein